MPHNVGVVLFTKYHQLIILTVKLLSSSITVRCANIWQMSLAYTNHLKYTQSYKNTTNTYKKYEMKKEWRKRSLAGGPTATDSQRCGWVRSIQACAPAYTHTRAPNLTSTCWPMQPTSVAELTSLLTANFALFIFAKTNHLLFYCWSSSMTQICRTNTIIFINLVLNTCI